MASLLISPHADDEALFASYIIMRDKPLVVIATDGTSHVKTFGITLEQRRAESTMGMAKLGVEVNFLGLPEEVLDTPEGIGALRSKLIGYAISITPKRVYVPALQGGHRHHDIVSTIATDVFKDACWYYSTYSATSLEPQGDLALFPSQKETLLKEEVLACYTSQLHINPHHFAAVKGKGEYLNFHP